MKWGGRRSDVLCCQGDSISGRARGLHSGTGIAISIRTMGKAGRTHPCSHSPSPTPACGGYSSSRPKPSAMPLHLHESLGAPSGGGAIAAGSVYATARRRMESPWRRQVIGRPEVVKEKETTWVRLCHRQIFVTHVQLDLMIFSTSSSLSHHSPPHFDNATIRIARLLASRRSPSGSATQAPFKFVHLIATHIVSQATGRGGGNAATSSTSKSTSFSSSSNYSRVYIKFFHRPFIYKRCPQERRATALPPGLGRRARLGE